jgi:glycogen synthase
MSYYAQNPDWWEKLVRKAMKIDFSWDVSADQYVDFYNQIVTNVHATRT